MESVLIMWCLLLFTLFLLFCDLCDSSVITSEITINNYLNGNSIQTCTSLGYDYFDSSRLNCAKCPSNQTASSLIIDGSGNSAGCVCSAGFETVSNSTCSSATVSTLLPVLIVSNCLCVRILRQVVYPINVCPV